MHKLGKKGIVLGQIVRMSLMALIIVGLFSGCANAFELVNRQAKNNFIEVVGQIEELDRQGDLLAQSGKIDFTLPKTQFAILDKETALVYYQRPFDVNIHVDVAPDATTLSDYRIIIKNPTSQTQSLCLIEEYNDDVESLSKVVTITPTDMSCEPVPVALEPGLANCGVGAPVNVESYSCQNGFFIDRGILKEAGSVFSSGIKAYYESSRSVNLFMVWQNDVVKIYDGEKETPKLQQE